MSNFVLGGLFLLMLLAPCVIDLSGWWKSDPEMDAMREAEEEQVAARAEAEALKACDELSLKPTYLLKEPQAVSLLPIPHGPEDLHARTMAAEREALEAGQVARRAAAVAMDAAARAAQARAEAANAVAMLAADEADAAAEAARVAFATYEQLRGVETSVQQRQAA